MVIRINGQPIDFTLEEEKTLGEVVRGLQSWVEERRLVVTSLAIGPAGGPAGGEELLGRPDAASWQAIPIQEVDCLSLAVAPAGGEPAAPSPTKAAAGGEPAPSSPADLEDLHRAMQSAVAALEGTGAELEEVSLLLQTGRDRPAMEAVIRFSDRFQELLGLLLRLQQAGRLDPSAASIEGRTLESFAAGLNEALRELLQAFQNRDSVLIGDLLEYEVAPRLAAIREFARRAI